MSSGADHSADRLAHRLRVARNRAFVGRAVELALFRSALAGDTGSFPVLFLHGPGGIGKSTLLRRFGDEARAAGRPVVEIDANVIAPTPADFEAAAGPALTEDGAVLLVDSFEQGQDLEHWLREQFLPRLPVGALAVFAGRRRPSVRWRTDSGWDGVLRIVALRDLAPEDAVALLTARGVAPRLHESVLAFAGGHPLALRLAAEDAVRDESRSTWTPTRDVLETLLDELMCEVPSALHRRALEICAHVLATTEELLRAVMPEADAGALFTWLRQLSFVESNQHGLYPHDVLRDALDADLRWRDPQGYQAMHYQIRAHVLERAREASGPDVLPAMAAITYLHRGGGTMPDYLTWQMTREVIEDQFRPEDRTTVLRLAAEAEGQESAAIVRFWLDRTPDAFRVHRRPGTGEPVGFMTWLRLVEPRDEEIEADPVVAAVWEHVLASGPLRPGEHVGIARFMICPADYQRPSPVMDLVEWRILAEILHQDRLAWSVLVYADTKFWEPLMTYIDHLLAGVSPSVGGASYGLFTHDWRPVPLEAWLALQKSRELFGARVRATARPAELVVLSRPEFDAAVRDALRSWRQPDVFAANPLTRSRVVADYGTADPVRSLRQAVREAVDALREDPREAKWHRAVTATFFDGVPTQEAAAERLGLAFSTYRRHLAGGLERVCDRLWHRELRISKPK